MAAFGWYFGPHLTNAWQDRQHNFMIRSDLVDELSLSSAQLMSAVQTREFHPDIESRRDLTEAFGNWDRESQVIDAKIATYFANGQQLSTMWLDFADAMRRYQNLPDEPKDKRPRRETLDGLASYLGWPIPHTLRHPPDLKSGDVDYQDAWVKLKDHLIRQRDSIVAKLLHAHGSG